VCRDETCISTATGRNGLAHALDAQPPATLADELLEVIHGA
jgi:hypothetical protein